MSLKRIQPKRLATRSGFSLLEMALAATLVTGTLVPALSVIRDAMAQSRELHQRRTLANYAVRILEDRAAVVATNWANTTASGDFSADGHGSIRYNFTQSDAAADGGIINQLMNITVTVYFDENSDLTFNTGEMNEVYRTKVAKLNSYENEEQ